jgi:hypothetical protein
MMKRQSRRATLLTLLAAFYLPLTLVTGIFGMNIEEFDGEKAPPLYLCFEAFFAVIAATAVFYGLYRYLPLVFLRPSNQQTTPRHEPSRSRRWYYIPSIPFRVIYEIFLWLERRRQQRHEESYRREDDYELELEGHHKQA